MQIGNNNLCFKAFNGTQEEIGKLKNPEAIRVFKDSIADQKRMSQDVDDNVTVNDDGSAITFEITDIKNRKGMDRAKTIGKKVTRKVVYEMTEKKILLDPISAKGSTRVYDNQGKLALTKDGIVKFVSNLKELYHKVNDFSNNKMEVGRLKGILGHYSDSIVLDDEDDQIGKLGTPVVQDLIHALPTITGLTKENDIVIEVKYKRGDSENNGLDITVKGKKVGKYSKRLVPHSIFAHVHRVDSSYHDIEKAAQVAKRLFDNDRSNDFKGIDEEMIRLKEVLEPYKDIITVDNKVQELATPAVRDLIEAIPDIAKLTKENYVAFNVEPYFSKNSAENRLVIVAKVHKGSNLSERLTSVCKLVDVHSDDSSAKNIVDAASNAKKEFEEKNNLHEGNLRAREELCDELRVEV